MIDLLNMPGDRSPRLADVLLAGGDGRGTWAALAPVGPPATRRGAGTGGSDRVTVILPDGAARNRWLRVTLLPSAYTGLSAPDVFYFGNLSGDTGNDRGAPTVDATDLALTRRAAGRTDAASLDRYDFNRDGLIGGADAFVVRHNLRRNLPLFIAPVAAAQNHGDLALSAVRIRTARPPRRGVLENSVAGLLA